MFDDHMPQGNAPSNLPVGEPEDMFAGTDPTQDTLSEVRMHDDTSVSSSEVGMPPPPTPTIQESRVAAEEVTEPLPTAMSAGKLQPVDTDAVSSNQMPHSTVLTADTPMVSTPSMTTMPPEMQSDALLMSDGTLRKPSVFRTLFMIVIVLVVALIVGGGVWYAVSRFFGTPTAVPNAGPEVVALPTADESVVTPVMNEGEIADTDTIESDTLPDAPGTSMATSSGSDVRSSSPRETAFDARESQILFGDTIDTDEDQLEDNKELEFGTDPRNWDTDGDRLSDGIEVLNWGTDPLNPDTDGDGFDDGDEVEAGYSPVAGGGARLFETTSSGT